MPPPPSLGMKTTPGGLERRAHLVGRFVGERLGVETLEPCETGTPAFSASFDCDQPIRARAALT